MMRQLDRKILSILLTGLIILLAQPLAAQFYFGKNKVQYTQFDWQVMTTEHFRIYFYSAESELAEIAARSAEESYRVLASRFNHEIYAPIPLIIYSNPNHFVQTNVTWSMLPENVAGFTEFIKGRVVVPFNGSYYDFDRVVRHELVHVFTISKLNRVEKTYGRINSVYPPLWFIEGLAEFWSRPWESDGDLIVRDMVINGTLPRIEQMWTVQGTYYMYKLGESICHFINDEYGAGMLTEIFKNWHMHKRFEEILAYTLGEKVEKISDKWTYYLKKKYYPQISDYDLPDKDAVRLTRREFAVRPVPVQLVNDRGELEEWVIYKANRVGYSA
ncbi:MAG: hypothetical protein GY841_11365, partial [FCB group bacterium]|nr:hypothetical protein [FCB group bacterium]